MTVVVDIFRVLAAFSSMVMILSPVPLIVRTCRTKTTGYASIVPLVSMLTNVHTLMMFGYLTEQYFPVFATFVAGDIISWTYVVLFYKYTHERAKAHKVFLLYAVPYFGLSTYALLGGFGVTNQSRHQVGDIIGYFSIVTSIIVFSSPLEKVIPVLKHRSAVFFNIHMICAGTFCNLMWVVYSSLTQRWTLFAPNSFSLVSGCFQITLYWIFHPSTHPLPALPGSEESLQEKEIDLESANPSPTNDNAARAKSYRHSPCFEALASPLAPLQPARIE